MSNVKNFSKVAVLLSVAAMSASALTGCGEVPNNTVYEHTYSKAEAKTVSLVQHPSNKSNQEVMSGKIGKIEVIDDTQAKVTDIIYAKTAFNSIMEGDYSICNDCTVSIVIKKGAAAIIGTGYTITGRVERDGSKIYLKYDGTHEAAFGIKTKTK